MPVPKGIDKDKYDRCVDKVKRKKGDSAYPICAASLKKNKENNMKKSELVEKLTNQVLNEEITLEEANAEIKKAITSLDVEGKTDLELEAEAKQKAETEEANEKAKELELEDGLFKEFSVGTTMNHTSTGTGFKGIKQPSMDYVERYKNSIKNIKVTLKKD